MKPIKRGAIVINSQKSETLVLPLSLKMAINTTNGQMIISLLKILPNQL